MATCGEKMAVNKYQAAHPEWFDDKGRVQPWVLRELIDYNPETGEIRWKERGPEWFLQEGQKEDGTTRASPCNQWNSRHANNLAGRVGVSGKGIKSRSVTFFNGVLLTGLALAYAIINGEYSTTYLATKDGDQTNTRIDNILSCNGARRVKADRKRESSFFKKRSSSIYLGVCKTGRSWKAGIKVDGKNIHLGYFKTEQEAADAYDCAVLKYIGRAAYANAAVHPLSEAGDPPRGRYDLGGGSHANRR